VPFNDIDSLEQALSPNTAAVLLEPVQGEGGVHVARPEYLRQVRELCTANGCLLILDEVQTGFCRTGRMFACEHSGVEPDILCLAKGMAGGIPIGAVVCSDRIEASYGMHGSTFGGNPLACAAGLAAIKFMEDHQLAEEAARKGAYLMEGLRERGLDLVREVRGLGLMVGIGLKRPVRPFLEHLTELGVLALPAGKSVLRLLPPLIIEDHRLDTVIEALAQVLTNAPLQEPRTDAAAAGRGVEAPGNLT
jgi:acetylornithine/LysW-gamma-L-lysine aminotransferase